MASSTQGDWGTVRWAHAMARDTEVIVSSTSAVAAGTVNEITRTHVRIGNKRVERKYIKKVTKLTRTNGT